MPSKWSTYVVLVVLHLCLLRCFPSTNLVDRADNCCKSLYFLFPSLFLCLFNIEFQNLLLSVPSVLSCVLFCSLSFPSYSFLLFFLFPVLCSPSVYSLCFLISLIVFFSNLLSFLPLFLLLCSVCFSLMLYYYSVCSISISLYLLDPSI